MFGLTSKTKEIYVVDNAIDYSLQEFVSSFCRNSRYTLGHSASSESHLNLTRFICHLTEDELKITSLDEVFRLLCLKHYAREVKIDRSYINIYFPYTPTAIHTDDIEENAVSFLIYANTQWELDWGGETNFFTNNLESVRESVIPKPGRALLFKSKIPHSARAPSVSCPVPRFTLTIKGYLE